MSKPPIFVVSLKRANIRRTHIESEAKKHHLSFQWQDAVEGSTLSDSEINSIYDDSVTKAILGRSLSRGEIGCYLSHLEIYKRMLENNIEYALVLEDDVTLNTHFKQFLEAIPSIPKDVEYVNLANYPNTSKLRGALPIKNGFKLKKHLNGIWGTYAYFITNAGAKKVVNSSVKIFQPIDYVARIHGHSKLNAYVAHPFSVSTEVDQLEGRHTIPSIIGQERAAIEGPANQHKPSLKTKTIILLKRILLK